MRSPAASVAVYLAAAAALFAQSESGRASIEGRLLDATNSAVTNATVTVRDAETGYTRKVVSEADGGFRIPSLPIGTYTIDTDVAGFAPAKIEGVQLTVGETRTVNIKLQIASTNTTVTVVADAPLVTEADASTALSISEKAVDELPIRGRNFTEFFQLSPGIVQEQDRYGMVVNGQRSINSNISLDGVDFNDSLQGGNRGGTDATYVFPQLAVQQFQIVRQGVNAEVGRTTSGFMNIVTKSGTNSLHGEALYANRNPQFTSPDAFNNSTTNNEQNQFGASLGGAIKRDKLFYFGSFEKNWLSIPFTVKFTTPSGGVQIPANIAALQGDFANVNNPLVAFGKIDYNLSEKTTLNVAYNFSGLSGLNFNGPTGQTTTAATANSTVDRAQHGIKVGLTEALSASRLNEFRFQYAYDHRTQTSVSNQPATVINDLGTIGGFADGGYVYNADRWEVLDNYTWTKGMHNVRTGVDFNVNPEEQRREYNLAGAYTYATLADFQVGKIQQYQQTMFAPGYDGFMRATQSEIAVFLQDQMRPRHDLNITLGVRWEGQFEPSPDRPNPAYPVTKQIPNDLKQFQPRFSLAWNVGGKDSSVVRVGAGLFSARTPGYLLSRAFSTNGTNAYVLDSAVDPNILKFITYPNIFTTLPPGVKFINSLYAFDPTFKNPQSAQFSASFEQKLDRSTKVIVGYVHQNTWHLQRRIDENLFPPVVLSNGLPVYPAYDSTGKLVYPSSFNTTSNTPVFTDSATGKTFTPAVARIDPSIGQVNINQSTAVARYDGLQINVERRLSHRLQFTFNYTYSVNKDNDSNERDFNRQTALNTYDFRSNWSYSKQDIRHTGNLQVLYDLPAGFTWSTLLLAHTGIPYTAIVGSDTQNDGNTVNDRTIINGKVSDRFGFRQPGFFDWDMRLLKTFRLGERARVMISAEGFNLTRSTNKGFGNNGESKSGKPTAGGVPNPMTGQPFANNSFSIPTASPSTDRFGGPRQVQLGARFVF